MYKRIKQSITRFLFLIVIAFSSACGQSSTTDSLTLSSSPSQIPATISEPVNTLEPAHLKGIIFYSDNSAIYSVNLENQETKTVIQHPYLSNYLIANNSIYITLPSETSGNYEIFKTNLNGDEKKQLTTDGAIQIFNVDPSGQYLIYNNKEKSLLMMDLLSGNSYTIAVPHKNEGFEWFFADTWSTDGKQLVYRRVLNPGLDDVCTFFIYDTVKKNSVQLLPDIEVKCLASLTPDGKKIALAGTQNQQVIIYILNLENYTFDQFSINEAYLSGLAWSYESSRLLIGAGKTVYFYNEDNLEEISTYTDITMVFLPSPNKTMMLYEQGNTINNLYLFDIAEIKSQQVYSQKIFYTSDWSYSSVWAPGGEYFSYFTTPETEENNQMKLFINIYEIETGNKYSFEVLPVDNAGFYKNPFWIYTN